MGLLAMIEGSSTRLHNCLHQAGLAISRRTADRARSFLSADAIKYAEDLAKNSPNAWFLTFDNINLYLRKHHQQRLDNANSMIHATNCALIMLPGSIDTTVFSSPQEWLALRSKRALFSPSQLQISDEDDYFMADCFDWMIAQIIADHVPEFQGGKIWSQIRRELSKISPKDRPLMPEKTVTAPLGVVDINEGSKAGCASVPTEMSAKLNMAKEEMASKVRILGGDNLTTRYLRVAQGELSDDVDVFNRLEYLHPVSQLFHFDMNACSMVLKTHALNYSNDAGSLSRQKDALQRVFDLNKAPYADAKALISHSLIARVKVCLMYVVSFSRDLLRSLKSKGNINHLRPFRTSSAGSHRELKRSWAVQGPYVKKLFSRRSFRKRFQRRIMFSLTLHCSCEMPCFFVSFNTEYETGILVSSYGFSNIGYTVSEQPE